MHSKHLAGTLSERERPSTPLRSLRINSIEGAVGNKKLYLIGYYFFLLFSTPIFAQSPALIQICKNNLIWDQPPVLPPHKCNEKRIEPIALPPECDLETNDTITPLPPCRKPSGRPISYGRNLQDAVITIIPYGYVKWQGYFDTRQEAGFREENTLIFPLPKKFDRFCQRYQCTWSTHYVGF